MRPKAIASLTGTLLAVVGFVVLLLPVSIESTGGTSIPCGSGLASNSRDADLYGTGQTTGTRAGTYASTYVDQCAGAVAGRRWIGWPLIVLGVAGLAAGMVLAAQDTRRATARS